MACSFGLSLNCSQLVFYFVGVNISNEAYFGEQQGLSHL